MQSTPTQIVTQIKLHGYCVIDNALPEKLCQSLYQQVITLPKHIFKDMGIGHGEKFHVDKSYRGDKAHWFDGSNHVEKEYLAWMEQLRFAINQHLYLGLFDYEAHFALYTPQNFYKKHLDAFNGSSSRMLTTVYYLNPDWMDNQGGELLIYKDESSLEAFQKVLPKMGTLVVFLSEQFPHEVIAANRDRYSIAGWFRIKAHI